jgi:hypothetical protein
VIPSRVAKSLLDFLEAIMYSGKMLPALAMSMVLVHSSSGHSFSKRLKVMIAYF